MMFHDLQDKAADPNTVAHNCIWRARLHHCLLRLVRWIEKVGKRELSAVEGSLAVMRLGSAVLSLQELLREPALAPGTKRAIGVRFGRIRRNGPAGQESEVPGA
ncbi:hypothetical protein E2C06_17930 [Dankookia rubra]|uniref:Uncharacterized protein n=1 Tax=Dankookia rubra TaxID=1442381 RepID=A0A4R5QEY8_9PROT|nr:FUSC family protein [Dankookia rubra]TDH61249.1 hypothetical protein E2C06_17930 [Dankookia rubra]